MTTLPRALAPDAKSQKMQLQRLERAAKAPATGVSIPSRNAMPITTPSKPMLHEPIERVPGAAIRLATLPKLLKATASRRRRRPNPRHPAGKLIKSFSRPYLLAQDKYPVKRVAIMRGG